MFQTRNVQRAEEQRRTADVYLLLFLIDLAVQVLRSQYLNKVPPSEKETLYSEISAQGLRAVQSDQARL
jgi:hypothetical protein